jgi:hypothetical protein
MRKFWGGGFMTAPRYDFMTAPQCRTPSVNVGTIMGHLLLHFAGVISPPSVTAAIPISVFQTPVFRKGLNIFLP